MNKFLKSNETKYRLARTIFQGIIGVLVAYLDVIVGVMAIPNELRPMIVALVMAVLSPIMSELGVSQDKTKPSEDYNAQDEEYMAEYNSLDEYEEEGDE